VGRGGDRAPSRRRRLRRRGRCDVVLDLRRRGGRERWPDGSLRPALEDLVGAGGIVAALGRPDASPEARAAALTYEALGVQRRATLADCTSARELVERGFAADVALCLDEDVSDVSARLANDCFVAA
jgi:2-phosphosulfolactate phosphatase